MVSNCLEQPNLRPISLVPHPRSVTCAYISEYEPLYAHSDVVPATPEDAGRSEEEMKARVLIEKMAAINLVEAFAYVPHPS